MRAVVLVDIYCRMLLIKMTIRILNLLLNL